VALERPDWKGQSVGFNASVQAGKTQEFVIPAFVAVAVDVPDVMVQFSRDKTGSRVQEGTWFRFVEEAGLVRVVVSSPRHETRTFDLEVSPGVVHHISLVDGGLVIKKEWVDFDNRASTQRTKGWLWLASGAGGWVVSGVLVFLWQDNRRQADNAYSQYLSASDVKTVKALRSKVADFDQKAGTYQWTGLTVGTLGLGAAGVGLYYLLFGPEPPSAKTAMASDGGYHATPWVDLGTDGGLVFGLSSWF
jgi:hypothetical protein